MLVGVPVVWDFSGAAGWQAGFVHGVPVWTSSQYGHCVLRSSIPRERGRSVGSFDAVARGGMEHEFHHILWVTEVHPGSGGGHTKVTV